jgi:hypothetical protein
LPGNTCEKQRAEEAEVIGEILQTRQGSGICERDMGRKKGWEEEPEMALSF